MKIRENINISELSTMKIGGIARYVFEVEDTAEVFMIIPKMEEMGIKKYYFLGSGANTFATDDGFDGVIIVNKIQGIQKEDLGDKIKYTVGGGVDWDEFVDETTKNGLTGIECLAGIPGTVGAAPVQNIGAYGQEVKDSISKILALDMKKQQFVSLNREECDFSYRHSIFNSGLRGRYFIYAVEFILEKGEIQGELYRSLQTYLDENKISSRSPEVLAEAVREVRNSKLPIVGEEASSGSFFKNIYVKEDEIEELDKRGIPHHGTKINVAWLIEQSGLIGKTFHGFRVSEKAPLVLINDSAKSYEELKKAVQEISKVVEEKFGFKLEQEPNVIGADND